MALDPKNYPKRLTIGISDEVHKKIGDLTAQFQLGNQWELVNLIIQAFNPDDPKFQALLKDHRTLVGLSAQRERQYKAIIENIPPELKQQISEMSIEEVMRKLLA